MIRILIFICVCHTEPLGKISMTDADSNCHPDAREGFPGNPLEITINIHQFNSKKTEQIYSYWILQFVCYHGVRHPKEMGEVEINSYLTHLAVNQESSGLITPKAPFCIT